MKDDVKSNVFPNVLNPYKYNTHSNIEEPIIPHKAPINGP